MLKGEKREIWTVRCVLACAGLAIMTLICCIVSTIAIFEPWRFDRDSGVILLASLCYSIVCVCLILLLLIIRSVEREEKAKNDPNEAGRTER